MGSDSVLVTPGEKLGRASEFKAGKGAYVDNITVYASLTGLRRVISPHPDSPDQRPTVEVTGPMVLIRSLDRLSLPELQDIRATEIDEVDMHQSFRPGDIVGAIVLSLGDAKAYFLSTAKKELGVISAQSAAGVPMVAISWTEMQCPITGQFKHIKVAKVGGS